MHHDSDSSVGDLDDGDDLDSSVDDLDDGTWQQPLLKDIPLPKTEHPQEADAPITRSDDTPLRGASKDPASGEHSLESDASLERTREGSNEWETAPPPLIEKGQVIFGKYQLIELLGEGGMGQVWLVHNVVLDRKSALKLIRPEIARNDRGWKRFKREAQLMAKLEHPNAVAVYDFNRTQSMAYIEMEFIRGRSVDKVLDERKGQPMPLEWIVPVVDQLCAVLQEAHGHVDENTAKLKSIIHRDLKPSNLMLVDKKPEGRNLKVLDFGIAKMIDEEAQDLQLTIDGEFMGTVSYSSPEQIQDGVEKGKKGTKRDLDGRSDLYSLGVLLFQCLTGVLPFRGTLASVLASHLTQPPPPMKLANPKAKVPPEVERLVRQCLEKDPTNRPQSAQELAEKFRAAAAHALPKPKLAHPLFLWVGAGSALVAIVLVAVMAIVFVNRNRVIKVNGGANDNKKMTYKNNLWVPSGYTAVKPLEFVPGTLNQPKQLRREADKVVFERYKDGIYLPIGYVPEDPGDMVGDWPRTIIRTTGKDQGERVRFFRIKGKTYLRGDPRPVPVDGCVPHWVKVSDFYIQETEVTNSQIEEYLQVYTDDKQGLEDWRKYYAEEKVNNPQKAQYYPAIAISYQIARKFALSLGGRLPTEAEWEFTAKSGDDNFLWAWGNVPPQGGKPLAHLFTGLPPITPVQVKKFGRDKTTQNVFDMTGNVREWCLDAYRPYAEFVPKGNGPDNPLEDKPWKVAPADPNKIDPNQYFVVRGGSFNTDPDKAMIFLREKVGASEEMDDLGFRVVIECPARPTE
jgi:serine/threonine protein kinase/formylglycine-generating enzyme required for sulfatase activity